MSLVATRTPCSAALVASTVTPGSVASLVSVTWPLIEPVVCAASGTVMKMRIGRSRRRADMGASFNDVRLSLRVSGENVAHARQSGFDLCGRDGADAEPEPARFVRQPESLEGNDREAGVIEEQPAD